MYTPALELAILIWWSMGILSLLEPASSCHLRNCSFCLFFIGVIFQPEVAAWLMHQKKKISVIIYRLWKGPYWSLGRESLGLLLNTRTNISSKTAPFSVTLYHWIVIIIIADTLLCSPCSILCWSKDKVKLILTTAACSLTYNSATYFKSWSYVSYLKPNAVNINVVE